MRRLQGWIAAIVCLAVAGFIRTSIPETIPDTYAVAAEGHGPLKVDRFSAELVDVEVGNQLMSVEDPSVTLESESMFVVARVRLTAHERTLLPELRLHTRDGYSYSPLEMWGLSSVNAVYVGQWNETTYLFEIPRDKVDEVTSLSVDSGAGVGVSPPRPAVTFDVAALPDPTPTVLVSPTDVGPAS